MAVLINLRLVQAEQAVVLVKFLIEHKEWVTAANRIYYGMYYALTALALKSGFKTSKHLQLIGWFNREFIATNMLDRSLGPILRDAYDSRMKGDYDAIIELDSEKVKSMVPDMERLIKEIKQLVG